MASDLVNVYLVLWLSKFVDDGLLANQDSAKSIFEEIILYSGLLLVCALPLIGWAADTLPPRYTLLGSFILRAGLWGLVPNAQNPNGTMIRVLVPAIYLATASQLVALDIVFFWNQPKNLRGALNGTRQLFSNFGTVFFIYFAGYQFDHVDKNAPFYICGTADLVFGLAVALMICKGLFTLEE